jgi:hypothetical protein
MVDEKTPYQKILTDWIFNQSVGVVISLCFVAYGQYQNNQLARQVEKLDTQVKDLLIYERDKMGKTLEENTKTLEFYKNYHRH